MHVIFSTKDRRPFLTSPIQERLYPYLGGIARESRLKSLAIGGVSEHVHLLISLPATLAIAKGVQTLKSNSSKWMHETFPRLRSFAWQEGYGAFSIGRSGMADTIAYIGNQEEHHRKRTLRDEFESILRKHDIEFEPWMIE